MVRRSPSDVHGVVFQACSLKCKCNLMSNVMKEKWANLTPEQYSDWCAKLGKNNKGGRGFINYHKKLRPERVKRVIAAMTSPSGIGVRNGCKGKSEKDNQRLHGDEWMPRGTCTLIAAHHEMLKDDPERLTTEFIEKLCNIDCKCKVKKDWGDIRVKEELDYLKQRKPVEFNIEKAEMDIDELFRRLKG